ncbi:MAG: hypothetical protein M3394_10495 [Actinomycetota bacterium]|nr:hypothetical protein [Actinomycetota bacterium]
MAPEESTVRLYNRLEDDLGQDVATVLVDNFATKKDLEQFTTKDELKVALADLELRMYRTMLSGAFVLVTTNVALWGSAVAVLR